VLVLGLVAHKKALKQKQVFSNYIMIRCNIFSLLSLILRVFVCEYSWNLSGTNFHTGVELWLSCRGQIAKHRKTSGRSLIAARLFRRMTDRYLNCAYPHSPSSWHLPHTLTTSWRLISAGWTLIAFSSTKHCDTAASSLKALGTSGMWQRVWRQLSTVKNLRSVTCAGMVHKRFFQTP
jgi:hypothetical protein